MSYFAYIDGIQVKVSRGTLSIEKRIEERSTAQFSVVDETGLGNFVQGMPVEILLPCFPPFHKKLFVGFIDIPERTRLGQTSSLLHDISCMDNHYLADKRLVVKSYENRTLEYIVEDILTDYLAAEGVTEGEIQTGPTIKSAIFNYVKASEAFDALKELSGFTWFIDEVKKLYFIDRTTYSAPWNLDSVTHRPIKGTAYLNTANPLYRNRQYIRGGKALTDQQTHNFLADGIIQSFSVGYPIAKKPEITDSVLGPRIVGIKGLETGYDYYWNKGDDTIYAEVVPVAGRTIEVKYYGQYPLIALSIHPTGATERQAIEGGSGFVEDIVTEAQHESADAIKASAQAKIDQYCQNAEKFRYQTHEGDLIPGQLQSITYAPFGFAAHKMLIESVTITAEGKLILYDISCITGPAMGSWAKFFSHMITRQDNQIKIGDSLLISLLHQSEILALAEATDLHNDAFPPDVSRWIALPPTQGVGHHVRHEALALAEAASRWEQQKGQYCWAPKTNGVGLREARWGFFTWG